MRTDRLYAITIYLMNHGKTSASELAKHFEVSVRTIQRDIDALCQAGVPVIALNGTNGGYSVAEQFVLNNQLVSKKEFSYILTALKGLLSASGNMQLADTYEKISALSHGAQAEMILDFSVLREGDETVLQDLQKAVREKKPVEFTYTNNLGQTKQHLVEPLAVMYRWYAWYLLAYSVEKRDYRTYKLVRMEGLHVKQEGFSREHPSAEAVLQASDRQYCRAEIMEIKVKCKPEAVYRLKEYLNGKELEKLQDGTSIMKLYVIETEQWWLGILLSLGDAAEVISPAHIKERIAAQAEKVLSLYKDI